jgi:integrase/recombinase XerD
MQRAEGRNEVTTDFHYSTEMRRLELVRLKLYDLSLDRGLLLVNQGNGSKDLYVPLGARAVAWLRKTSKRRGHSLPSSRTTSQCS